MTLVYMGDDAGDDMWVGLGFGSTEMANADLVICSKQAGQDPVCEEYETATNAMPTREADSSQTI